MKRIASLLLIALLLHGLLAEARSDAYIEVKSTIRAPIDVDDVTASYYFLFKNERARGTANLTIDLEAPLSIDLYMLLSGEKREGSAFSAIAARLRIANESDPRLNITVNIGAVSNMTLGSVVKKDMKFNATLSDSGALSQRIGLRSVRIESRGAATLLTEGRWLNATVAAIIESRSGSSFVDRTVAVFIYSTAEELLMNLSKYLKTLYPAAKFSYNVTLEQTRVRISIIAQIPLGADADLSALRSEGSYRFLAEMSAKASKGSASVSMRYQLEKTSGGNLDYQGTLAGKLSDGVLEATIDMKISKRVMDRAMGMISAARLLSAPPALPAALPAQGSQELPQINLGKVVASLEAAAAEIEKMQATAQRPKEDVTTTAEAAKPASGINPVLIAAAVFTLLAVSLVVLYSRRG